MPEAAVEQVARFRIMLNCYNCRIPSSRTLGSLPAEITTEDDLVESGILDKQKFSCPKCDCPIGAITAIKVEWLDVPF